MFAYNLYNDRGVKTELRDFRASRNLFTGTIVMIKQPDNSGLPVVCSLPLNGVGINRRQIKYALFQYLTATTVVV